LDRARALDDEGERRPKMLAEPWLPWAFVGALLAVAVAIYLAGMAVAAGLASLAETLSTMTYLRRHWVADDELKEDDPGNLVGRTFSEHLPAWRGPSALEAILWQLVQLRECLAGSSETWETRGGKARGRRMRTGPSRWVFGVTLMQVALIGTWALERRGGES